MNSNNSPSSPIGSGFKIKASKKIVSIGKILMLILQMVLYGLTYPKMLLVFRRLAKQLKRLLLHMNIIIQV